MNKNKSLLLEQLLDVVDFYKGIVLDSVEQTFGNTQEWKYLRSRLLKAFGDRGMEARIKQILNNTQPNEEAYRE